MVRLCLLCACLFTIGMAGDGCPPEPGGREPENGESARVTEQAREKKTQEDRWKEKRHAMVEHYIEGRSVGSPAVESERVLDAMRKVPRHLFVPERYRDRAYSDTPLPIGHDQTISQPYIVALMTDRLQVEPDDRVLEVGTGSGYQAAVLSELCREVYTIEIVEGLAKEARERLKRLGYDNVRVRHGDGFYGWEEHAPFDGIIVTAAADELPQPLLGQLKPGGRMVIPVDTRFGAQELLAVKKTENGEVRRERITLVRFVPMTGRIEEVN